MENYTLVITGDLDRGKTALMNHLANRVQVVSALEIVQFIRTMPHFYIKAAHLNEYYQQFTSDA